MNHVIHVGFDGTLPWPAAVEQLVMKPRVEGLAVAVLSHGLTSFNIEGPGAEAQGPCQGYPGLSHMTMSKLGKETSEELVAPAGSLELSLYRAFGPLQLGQIEGQSA